VLAWQAALLEALGVERVLCLCDDPGGAVLAVQHAVEAHGATFHALRGFAALPALVRAEDDLVIIADGLVPDPAVVLGLLQGEGGVQRLVATIPADHPLAAAYPQDFERIDAARHWAGVLAMRGAPVQQLADFPGDADAAGLLLRLALQTGTPARPLASDGLAPERWLLAHSPQAAAQHEQALIAEAAARADGRAPLAALASMLVRALAPSGLTQGGPIAAGLALLLLLGGVMAAAFGAAAAGLAAAGLGAFAAAVANAFAALAARLRRAQQPLRSIAALGAAVDLLAALALWFALAPWPQWQPLAALGPLTIGLARLAAREDGTAMAALASDRASLLLVLALAAALGLLPEVTACLALGLLAALLLRARKT